MQRVDRFCCKNVGDVYFKACGKPAVHFYLHDRDICPYCEEHNYACGEKIDPDVEDTKSPDQK